MSYVALVEAKRNVAPSVRARIALDVVESLGPRTAPLASARGRRVRVAEIALDPSGRVENARAIAKALEAAAHPTTLLWEILAAREADTDELPWADPASDLPDDLLDAFASLTVRPPSSIADMTGRLLPALRAHAATREEVEAACRERCAIATPVVPAPAQAAPITLRAPAKTADALRAMREDAEDADRSAPRALPEPPRAPSPVPAAPRPRVRRSEPEEAGATTQRLDAIIVQELIASSHAPTTTHVEMRDERTPVPWLADDPVELPQKRSRARAVFVGALAAAAIGAVVWIGLGARHRSNAAAPSETASLASTAEAVPTPPARSAWEGSSSGEVHVITTEEPRSAEQTGGEARRGWASSSSVTAPSASAPLVAPRPAMRGKLPRPAEPPVEQAPPPPAPSADTTLETLSRESSASPE